MVTVKSANGKESLDSFPNIIMNDRPGNERPKP